MTRFRNPGARERAWAIWLAKRGVTAADVLTSDKPPTEHDRLAAWRAKHDRLPAEFKARHKRFQFTPAREPVDPDNYLRRSA